MIGDFRELSCETENSRMYEGKDWRAVVSELSTGLHMCITCFNKGLPIRPSKAFIKNVANQFFVREHKLLPYTITSHITPEVAHLWENNKMLLPII